MIGSRGNDETPELYRHDAYRRMPERDRRFCDIKTKKNFDAVAMLREARDRISRDIQGMSFEEQAAYFKKHAEQVRRKLQAPGSIDAVPR